MELFPPLSPTVDAALRDVDAKRMEFRLRAAMRLADPPEERRAEARAALARLSKDVDARVATAALEALGSLGERDDVTVARDALRHRSRDVRDAATHALARLGREDVRDELVALLTHEEPEIRFQAVRGLAALGDASLPTLAGMLEDSDAEVRVEAALALASFGATSYRDAIHALLLGETDAERAPLALALADLGDRRAIGFLRPMLRGRADADRLEAALALGKLRAHEARDDLARLAEGFFTSPHVRAASAAACAALGDPRGLRVLRRLLDSRRGAAASFAVKCVGDLAIVECAADLERLVANPRGVDPSVLRESLARLETAR